MFADASVVAVDPVSDNRPVLLHSASVTFSPLLVHAVLRTGDGGSISILTTQLWGGARRWPLLEGGTRTETLLLWLLAHGVPVAVTNPDEINFRKETAAAYVERLRIAARRVDSSAGAAGPWNDERRLAAG